MKIIKFLSCVIICSINFYSKAQIANQHPNDIGIQTNTNVILAEMFEQNSISTLTSQSGYTSLTMTTHILFDPSVPAGSTGSQSLKLRTVETSTVSNDPNEDSNLLIKFPGVTDSIFVRYYVKYNSNFTFHHSGVWAGGTNTNIPCWPCYKPGRTYPVHGDSAFAVGSELRGSANSSPQTSDKMAFYNYYMDMNIYTTGPNAGKYYGNEFISPNSNANINLSNWNCIEFMVKLNNPVNDSTGELKLWINGQVVSHYGKGFPNGTWVEAHFNEASGSPFEGFRWRSDPAVALNYVWLKNYATDNTSSANNDILFDHLVVAKSYIGPISIPTNMNEIKEQNSVLTVFPNPSNEELHFSISLKNIFVFNIMGEVVMSQKELTNNISVKHLSNGVYFIRCGKDVAKFIVEH